MKKYLYLLVVITSFIFTSCGNFLKEYSQTLTYASSLSDLDEVLIGSGYLTTNYSFLHVMDDDSEEFIGGDAMYAPLGQCESFHLWFANPFVTTSNGVISTTVTDDVWSGLYKHISVVNEILNEADNYNADVTLYRKIKGECYFLRASYYFTLVNLYAKPYSTATSSTDPGVPLKLTYYVEDIKYTRTPVEKVYNQIVSDLKSAITNLSGLDQTTTYRVNEWAAKALLGRVYLYMGQWQQTVDMCNDVINNGTIYSLIDLNNYSSTTSFTYAGSPETLFTMGSYNVLSYFPDYCSQNLEVSEALLNSYETNDLRPSYSFGTTTSWTTGETSHYVYKLHYPETSTAEIGSEFSIRLPEIYLNKAEALTMLAQPEEAAKALDILRLRRIKNYQIGEITATGQELVDLVRAERRRELCFEGHRWFDLRRYAVNPLYPLATPIIHNQYIWNSATQSVQKTGYYKLDTYINENGGGWILPIPNYEMNYEGINAVQNERPKRSLINK